MEINEQSRSRSKKRNYVSVPSGRLSRLMNLASMSAGITGNILFSAANNFFSGKQSNFQDLITSEKTLIDLLGIFQK